MLFVARLAFAFWRFCVFGVFALLCLRFCVSFWVFALLRFCVLAFCVFLRFRVLCIVFRALCPVFCVLCFCVSVLAFRVFAFSFCVFAFCVFCAFALSFAFLCFVGLCCVLLWICRFRQPGNGYQDHPWRNLVVVLPPASVLWLLGIYSYYYDRDPANISGGVPTARVAALTCGILRM